MIYKTDLTPEHVDEYLNRKYIQVNKKYYMDDMIVLELFQCGEGEYSLDTMITISFEPTIEHLQVLSKNNIYIKQ